LTEFGGWNVDHCVVGGDRSGAEVVLFEKEATCGGHTLTDDSGPVPVDLGFQVL
jgi:hypothetical protein